MSVVTRLDKVGLICTRTLACTHPFTRHVHALCLASVCFTSTFSICLPDFSKFYLNYFHARSGCERQCDCGIEMGRASQRAIFRGTDGSAAAAAPWTRTRRSHRPACRSPPLLCPVESPPTPPCPPFYRTEGSGNLAETNTDAHHGNTPATTAIKQLSILMSFLLTS